MPVSIVAGREPTIQEREKGGLGNGDQPLSHLRELNSAA
jgi:hypothetical protein